MRRGRRLARAVAAMPLVAGCASHPAPHPSSHVVLVLAVRPLAAGQRAGDCSRDPGSSLYITNGGATRLAQPTAQPPATLGTVGCSWRYSAVVPDRPAYAIVDKALRHGNVVLTHAELAGMAWFVQVELAPVGRPAG